MANNHILDWGQEGLLETIETLERNHINYGGIGFNFQEARRPFITYINEFRVIIFSVGDVSSGIPLEWKAKSFEPGVNLIDITQSSQVERLIEYIRSQSNEKDFIIVSIHWGSNWGWEIDYLQEKFAHSMIDKARVDLIHGHSSHHFKPMEIYKKKLILYGCGDLINDYEDIKDPSKYKYLPEISLAYFPTYNNNKDLVNLIVVPYTIENMQLIKPSNKKIYEVYALLDKICKKYNLSFTIM